MITPVRSCGACTACCKPLEAYDGTFHKPAGEWCKYCDISKGCKIYETRPGVCSGFRCQWLMGFGEDTDRPDKTRIIVDFHKVGFFEEGACELWEVSEAALQRPYAAQVTRWMIERDIPVTHRPLGGKQMTTFLPPSLSFKEIFEVLEEENIKLGSLDDI